MKPHLQRLLILLALLGAGAALSAGQEHTPARDELERGFLNPPSDARPHAYWLWLNGYVHAATADEELAAMKEAGLSGVLLFDMGARGDRAAQPPAGPAFLSDAWLKQFRASVTRAKQLGLQVDFSVISSWDLGGHWIEPRYASMGLYPAEAEIEGGKQIDVALPFPAAPAAAPKGADGRPAFWRDVAVLAVRDAQRGAGQKVVFREVVDVTARVEGDRLRWDAPAGRWAILRYVCMNTGERLKVPSPASDGWATDHLNPEATRAHMNYVIGRLRETFGDLRVSGLTNLYLASYEVRGPVWSPGFTREFKQRRGYEMTRFLPAVFGATVDDEETTRRFLFDYRKTLGEVLIDAYYNAARVAAHQAGLTIKSEAGGPGPPVHNVPVDALLANAAVDEIQGEFWPFRPNEDGLWVVKETASAGHIYGKPRVHMEAFTSRDAWREGPQDLKASADRVFVEGGNHMVWHTWTHAPPDAGQPGWVYGAGTHLNRNVTWWPKAKPFIDYLARSSYLLQRGRFVADVLYYYGDGGYKFVGPRRNDAGLGPGYDYDVTNSDVILHRLDVRDGRLVLPDGQSYAVLVLPEAEEMNPAVLDKIERLAMAGATVIGPKPMRAHGLEGAPASDARVRELADKLWGDLDGRTKKTRAYGKGRVVWGETPRQVLAAMKIQPDFVAPTGLDFIHRRDGAVEIYFVRNRQAQPVRANVRFRIADREPEFWDAQTGRMERAAVYRRTPEGVEMPVELAANGSIFVVFRRPARADAIVNVAPEAAVIMRDNAPLIETSRNGSYVVTRDGGRRQTIDVSGLPAPLTLDGEWSIEFEKGRGAPAGSMKIASLASWTEHADPAVKFFSGTARYRKTFTLPPGWKGNGRRVYLDFGDLWTIGEAWLNGQPLGVLWTQPFRADCAEALRDGENELTMEVTNNWFNRLVGDAALPSERRLTRTNITSSGGKPWARLEPRESGLFGPVRLIAVARQPLDQK
ncbi:MAG: glycosyl hydrolase [Blastocatellales bacterium]